MSDLLEWLQEIYANDLCNGSWEHTHGFSITNIDNPGWEFKCEISNTEIEDIPFEEVSIKNSENDWYRCRIQNGTFEGWGGASNLSDIIRIFKEWYIHASQIARSRSDEP